jgi:hypothetical protein
MKIKPIILIACIALQVFFLSGDAKACSCVNPTPCEAFGAASAVFIGRMVNGTEKVEYKNYKGEQVSLEAGLVTFTVEESFKGVSDTSIKIYVTSMKGTSCGDYGLTPGTKYLVYAYEYSGKLGTGVCTRTRPVESDYAKEDMDFLRNLPKQGTGGRLYGKIGMEQGGGDPVPLTNITVIVENELHEQVKAITDQNGHYEIKGLKPGKYQVTPLLGEHYEVYEPTREVLISDRGCATTSYWTKINGSVSGRIVDSAGRTAPATLKLVRSDNEKSGFSDYSEGDGEFVVDGVPPGRYLLYVKIVSADQTSPTKSKEQPFYYPGVFEREKATVIEVGMGEQQEGYGFTLPSFLKVEIVTGVIQYPDGRPAANAAVIFSILDKTKPGIYRTDDWGGGRIDTDESGRFELHAFKGNSYQLEAQESMHSAIKAKRRPLYSELRMIKLDADVKDVKLVLTSPTSSLDRERMQMQKKTPQ